MAGKKKEKKEKKPKVTQKQKQKQRQSTKVIVNIDNSHNRKTKTNSKNSKPPQIIQPPNIYQQLQPFPLNYLQEQNIGNPIGNNLINPVRDEPNRLNEQPQDLREILKPIKEREIENPVFRFPDYERTADEIIAERDRFKIQPIDERKKIDLDELQKELKRTPAERDLAKDLLRQQIVNISGNPVPSDIINNEKKLQQYLKKLEREQKRDSNLK